MVTTYNPAEVDRLIAEAREDDARMTDAPWHGDSVSGVLFGDGNHEDGSIELAHMDGEAKEFDPVAIARQRNNLRSVADQLAAAKAEVDLRSIELAMLRQLTTEQLAMIERLREAQTALAKLAEPYLLGGDDETPVSAIEHRLWCLGKQIEQDARSKAEIVRQRDEAQAGHIAEPRAKADASPRVLAQIIRAPSAGDRGRTGIRVIVDDEVIGTGDYGGEPEDNCEYRDYAWVKELLVTLAGRLGAEATIESVEVDGATERAASEAYYTAMAAKPDSAP